MWDSISYFILVPMVYLAFATLIIGLIYKLLLVYFSPGIKGVTPIFPKKMAKIPGIITDAFLLPSTFKKQKFFWAMIIIFHVFFLFLFIGHLELIADFSWIQVIPHQVFLGAGVVGIVLMITTLYFLFRRFGGPYRRISVPEDYIVLLILFFSIMFGSILHLADRYSDYGSVLHVGVEAYRSYLGSLFSFQPDLTYLITETSHFTILVLHVLFANIFMMMFPFTKMVHAVFTFLAHNRKRM